MGFGIIIPLLPLFAAQYHASPLDIGLLFSIYSACQFVASPILGAISDRFGRRPVLIFSQLGSSLGYLLLGLVMNLHWVHPDVCAVADLCFPPDRWNQRRKYLDRPGVYQRRDDGEKSRSGHGRAGGGVRRGVCHGAGAGGAAGDVSPGFTGLFRRRDEFRCHGANFFAIEGKPRA